MKPYTPEICLRYFDRSINSFTHPANTWLIARKDTKSNIGAHGFLDAEDSFKSKLIPIPWSGHLAKGGDFIFHGDLITSGNKQTKITYVCWVKASCVIFVNIATGYERYFPSSVTPFYNIVGSALLQPSRILHAQTRALFDFHAKTSIPKKEDPLCDNCGKPILNKNTVLRETVFSFFGKEYRCCSDACAVNIVNQLSPKTPKP